MISGASWRRQALGRAWPGGGRAFPQHLLPLQLPSQKPPPPSSVCAFPRGLTLPTPILRMGTRLSHSQCA